MKTNYKYYNFDKSLERIDEILNTTATFEEKDSIPSRSDLTFTNGYYVRCCAIFIDIRDSSKLPSKYKRPTLAKIYRSFISEVVAVLNGLEECKEINIVGDCVSGIFEAQYVSQVQEAYRAAYTINSIVNILNYKLCKKDKSPIKIGIGIAFGRALMIKAGYNGSSINDVVWMGDVVNQASNLCSKGNKKYYNPIVIDEKVYEYLEEKDQGFFTKNSYWEEQKLKSDYHGNVIRTDMEKWLEEKKEKSPCDKAYI